MEKGTFLSIEIDIWFVGICLSSRRGSSGIIFIKWCRGYLHLSGINSREKRKGGGGREGKADLRDKA